MLYVPQVWPVQIEAQNEVVHLVHRKDKLLRLSHRPRSTVWVTKVLCRRPLILETWMTCNTVEKHSVSNISTHNLRVGLIEGDTLVLLH